MYDHLLTPDVAHAIGYWFGVGLALILAAGIASAIYRVLSLDEEGVE